MIHRNKKTVIDGIKFDSLQESRRYVILKLMLKNKQISSLVCHPKFLLQDKYVKNGSTVRQITYSADFSYFVDGKRHIEDVKPLEKKTGKFMLTEVFRIKKKLFEKIYPLTIEIVE